MHERSGKILIGVVLLIVGVLMILDLFGIDGDDIFRYLIPLAIMLYGGRKLVSSHSTGSKVWGVFVFLFGLLMLIGKMKLLFSSLLAIGIIVLGYRLLRRSSRQTEYVPSYAERHWAQSVLKEDMLDRWDKEMATKRN